MTCGKEETRERVYALVRRIPRGKVMNYGQIGYWLDPPIGARQVGRIMYSAPEGVPWWRVVGADGSLPIHRREAQAAWVQQEFLQSEGVALTPGLRVKMKLHRWEPSEEQ